MGKRERERCWMAASKNIYMRVLVALYMLATIVKICFIILAPFKTPSLKNQHIHTQGYPDIHTFGIVIVVSTLSR